MSYSRSKKVSAVVFAVCVFLALFLMGAMLLSVCYFGLVLGELEVPKKFSSDPTIIVTRTYGAFIYYFLLIVYFFFGFACIAISFFNVWKLWHATPMQREVMGMTFQPPKTRRRAKFGRSLFIFVVVPFVVFGFMFITMVLGKG